jgi:MarR family transcriptional regulator, organic hydroperoxide resistance regulator
MARGSEHLRLEGEVVGLWFEMQARLEAHFTDLAAQYKLSAVQAKVLLLLQHETAMTMRSIAGALQYDASNLTGVVDRLEELGAVRRQPHPSDRRAKGVLLTTEGQRMRRAFWERLTGNTGPLGRLNDRELVSLRRLLGTALRRPAASL